MIQIWLWYATPPNRNVLQVRTRSAPPVQSHRVVPEQSLPVDMHKPKQGRDIMPDWALLLQREQNALAFCGPHVGTPGVNSCELCLAAEREGAPAAAPHT